MKDIVIGIDFGTTNSCLSYYNIQTKNVQVIPNEQGNFTSPSILFLDSDSPEILFSDSALQLLRSNNNQNYLSNIFNNLKRLVGKSSIDNNFLPFFKHNKYSDGKKIEFETKYNNEIKLFTPQNLITFYLKYLKNIICTHFSIEFNNTIDIVITVPAYFDDNQRTIIKECCNSIAFNVIRIINEPTAASLAYALDKYKKGDIEEEFILTFDCGGGTTDVSLLHLDYTNSVYEVKNTIGDNILGGEDITNNLVNFIIEKLHLKKDIQLTSKILNKIRKQAEEAKKNLSFNSQTTIYLELGDKDYSLSISQSQFNEINNDFYRKVKNLIYHVLDDYIQKTRDFEYSKINSIIFVGGTTKIPYFKTLFQDIFPEASINNTIDPDQTISIGASIQGALIKDLIDEDEGGETLLMDIIPLSIGIETIGGIMTPIISRNTLLPISRTQVFVNSESYEEIIVINIYQGERKFVKDNIFLASFTLQSDTLSLYDKGEVQISITFDVDLDSIITAKAIAKVNSTEIESTIQVTKTYSTQNTHQSLDDILLSAEMNKLVDNELSNKILAKIELYDSFKYLLSVFHDKKTEKQNQDEFLLNQLNELFNHTFNIINNYTEYTSKELIDIKNLFEKKWHTLLFSGNILLKNNEGQIIEFGGTTLD
jgi:molecular chaperone DnaK (HSP70)